MKKTIYLLRRYKGGQIKVVSMRFTTSVKVFDVFDVYCCGKVNYFISIERVVSFLRYHGVTKEEINKFLFDYEESKKVKKALEF